MSLVYPIFAVDGSVPLTVADRILIGLVGSITFLRVLRLVSSLLPWVTKRVSPLRYGAVVVAVPPPITMTLIFTSSNV